jgi:hypothetical protein
MRDQQLVLPFGSLSMRKFFLFISAIFVAIFVFPLTFVPTAHAQTAPSSAEWNGNSITYNQHAYVPIADAKAGDSHNIPAGSKIYSYTETITSGSGTPTTKAYLIYFVPGIDPPKATSATLVTYDLQGTKYSNPSSATQITLTPQTDTSSNERSSCSVAGIGWIVCPVSSFLAKSMDWLFSVLANFLTVQPLQSNSNNALYNGWSIMRNFANVAFVIAFLVVVYSQISNLGLSNYGLKKMLPRLIIAAILVNISYWICAIAVDASNILGYSVQDILMNLRQSVAGTNASVSQIGQWESITSAVLAGGTLATAGVIALVSIGSVTGAIAMLLPVLVFVIIAALVAILIMAIRQALIVILVIIAPLAFVAFLLPNTEKYFERWRELFATMLLLFPIFAIIFGGSQVAGMAIIQNANSIVMLILGMATQVAPLFVLPFLLKFSGGLIGKIAGVANNKSKGLLDRTRNFSQEYADLKKTRVQARPAPKTRFGRALRLRGLVQGAEHRRLSREHEMGTNKTVAENAWRGSKKYEALDTASREAERDKKILEQQHDTNWAIKARIDTKSLERELKLRVTADESNAAQNRLDTMHEEFRAGRAPAYGSQTASMTDLLNRSETASRDLALTALRKQAAERTQKEDLTQAYLKNTEVFDGTTLREYAGGIRGAEGASSVLASSVAAYRKEYGEHIAEKAELLRHFNLSTSKTQELALGTDVTVTKGDVTYTFKADDDYAREAAVSSQLKAGSEAEKLEIVKESGMIVDGAGNEIKGKTYNYRTSIQSDIVSNNMASSSLILGSKTINDVAQGNVYGDTGLENAAVYHIMEGKIRDDVLAVQGAGTLKILYGVGKNDKYLDNPYYKKIVSENPEKAAAFRENYEALRRSAAKILEDQVNRNSSEAARKVFQDNLPPEGLPEDITEY